MLLILVPATGRDEDPVRERLTPAAGPAPAQPPPLLPAPPGGDGLAIGITEQNPALMWAPGERRPEVAEPFAARAAELRALRPHFYRLVVDWSLLQPDAAAPPDFDAPQSGCLRARGPCAAFAGMRERLRALAARQREGGWETLVVPLWTPPWAAAPARGCERARVDPRARPPRADALDAYRALVRGLLRVAAQEGARLAYWAPWNEPNHPGFISPQRLRCDPGAPTAAAAPYARIARALQVELEAAPGEQRLVLGETAGLVTRAPTHTPVAELVRALPEPLVCSAGAWSTHGYVPAPDPVDALDRALRAKGCPKPIWITETGFRGERRACAAMARRLARWHADPRVAAAFQYTFRTDDRFPTGLASTDLRRTLPELEAWMAWGGGRAPGDPPPARPC